MSIALISNPPYNMKWKTPVFAQLQPRFNDAGVHSDFHPYNPKK